MGNKALSHDSVFIFESAPGNVAGDTLSQENIPGRVKTLQVRTSFTAFGSILPLGSCIFEQFWCFEPCLGLTVCE
uniref:Uncharacterized protein n=1 Tax=Strix occidentalis caurina TaxID=311401 RepID=A0A8D0EPE2_STROC